MSKKITFSAFGRDSYYHRDWFKKNGFKFDRSSRKWIVENLPIEHAERVTLYFDYRTKAKRINEAYEEMSRLNRDIWDKQYEMRELMQRKENLKETIDELRK